MTTAGTVVMTFELDLPGFGVQARRKAVSSVSASARVAPRAAGGRVVRVSKTVQVAPVTGTARVDKLTGTSEAC